MSSRRHATRTQHSGPHAEALVRRGGSARRRWLFGAIALAAALNMIPSAWAQAVALGSADDFGVLAGSAITSSGATIVTGDLGIWPNNASSVTGFPPGQVVGTSHFADGTAFTAQNDLTAAYNEIAGRACATTIAADLGGTTLGPGVYCAAGSMGLTGTLTLDAQGNPDAIFIFQVGSTLTTASASMVRMINAGEACNVFWQIGSSATLGTATQFSGTLIALESITLTTGASTSGRVLARNGAVTLDGSTVAVCALTGGGAFAPTLGKAFSPATIPPGGVSVLTITLTNPAPAATVLTSPLTDTLPAGVFVASIPDVSTTCGGTAIVAAAPGSSSITLSAGTQIPANASCSVRVLVTAAAPGVYTNVVPVGSLVTSTGNNQAPALASLTVIAGTLGDAVRIPAASAVSLSVLLLLLLLVALVQVRGRES
jgi:hypothetical protein